jgi:alkanesulfonate monooxygenase SsuD/methylene tetrahydromethanopterin reductase-like flavin-dependent oxidoreductase (luciferase family)
MRADFRRRGRLADEYLQVMKQLWTADRPRFAGEQIQFDDVLFSPKPARPGGIPIVVGGAARRHWPVLPASATAGTPAGASGDPAQPRCVWSLVRSGLHQT